MQPLISPPRHRFGPRLPAPRLFVLHLFVPRLPRCCRSLPLLLSPRLPRCGCRLPLLPSLCLLRCRRFRIPKRRTARTSPARSEQPHDPRPFSHPAQGSATARVPFAVLPGAPVPALPGAQKRRTEPHRGPSAAKKQPICRGSITAAALQPVRSVHSPETNPLRIVRAGISG